LVTPVDYLDAKGTNSYIYTALNEKGKLLKGSIKASSEGVASNMIAERGLNLVSIQLKPVWYSLDQMLPSLFAVKPQEVINFSRQLATLLEAGISIMPALESVRQQSSSRGFRKVLGEAITDLGAGLSFSEALRKNPKVFTEIYYKTIRVAESTGELHIILRQLADYQEKQDVTRKKIKKALTYPAVLLTLGLGVGIILMTTALPALIDIFTMMSVDLPLPTRILIGLTDFLGAYKLYLLVIAIVIAVVLVYLLKQPAGRKWLDGFLLRAPLIGAPIHSSEIGRFARTGQVLLSAGLSLQEVMDLLPSTSGNSAIRDALDHARQDLIRGEGLAEPMIRNAKMFPSLLTQMVKVGEESNTLDYTLGVVADFYENDADEKITAFVGKIAPTMTMVMAGLVGFLALAIIMPMYSITGAVA
jgi:type IV pilus assembly protein PilC